MRECDSVLLVSVTRQAERAHTSPTWCGVGFQRISEEKPESFEDFNCKLDLISLSISQTTTDASLPHIIYIITQADVSLPHIIYI